MGSVGLLLREYLTAQKSVPLQVRCTRDSAIGKIVRKEEISKERHDVYNYAYDAEGHLFRVFRNELLQEGYHYTPAGQRMSRSIGWNDQGSRYFYGSDGCLYVIVIQRVKISFEYDKHGNLALRKEEMVWEAEQPRTTTYAYKYTCLQRATLSDGTAITYRYGDTKNPVGPVAVYHNATLVMEYEWQDLTKLAACVDHRTQIRYDFAYEGRSLARVRLRKIDEGARRRILSVDVLEELPRELFVGCDQVNTPKVFTDASGREVKRIEYDSFGIILDETCPELFIPVGFAGGLRDRYTGFVRFGYRDYDPFTGRFTCPDPAMDLRGDGDIYDYCVDDPVSSTDPLGLWTQANFDESKVDRDADGKFSSGGGGTQVPRRATSGNEDRAWRYNQRTGQLRRPDGVLLPERGYSGAPGYVNDPIAEEQKDKGPIPKGRWRIGDLKNSQNTGSNIIPLYPEGHDARGRTDMQIHGEHRKRVGKRDSSKGCIVLPLHIRLKIGEGEIRYIDVVDESEWKN